MEAADAPPPPEPAPAVVANGASNTDRPLPQEIAEPAPAVVANGASNAEARPQPQEIAAVAQAGALAAVHSLSSLAGGALASLAGAPAEPVPVEEPGPAARPLPVLSHSSLENLLSDKILTLLNRATEDVAAAPPQDCLQSLSHIPAKQADGALDWMRRRIFMTDSLVVRHKTLVVSTHAIRATTRFHGDTSERLLVTTDDEGHVRELARRARGAQEQRDRHPRHRGHAPHGRAGRL